MRFLTPEASLVCILVLVPLAALGLVGERGRRMRSLLGLPEPGSASWVLPALGLVAVAVLLALAAAQPVLANEKASGVRRDVQAVFVLDASRSMLAAPPGGTTRFQRARNEAIALRHELSDVPVGVASLTDRMLPHLLPNGSRESFDGVVRRAVGPDRPPPGGYWERATSFAPVADIVTRNYFNRGLRRRVIVVFTDGEARSPNVPALAQPLRQAEGVRLLFLRFWSETEQVRVNGRLEPQYRPDSRSGPSLVRLARALRAQVLDEHDQEGAADALRRAVGSGPLARRASERDSLALAPWAVVLALVPFGFLLWSRNRA
jgi:hypothetical protein